MVQMGKNYKTRDGRRVRILCIDAPCDNKSAAWPIAGFIDGSTGIHRWTKDGYWCQSKNTHVHDLIECPREKLISGFLVHVEFTEIAEDSANHIFRDLLSAQSYSKGERRRGHKVFTMYIQGYAAEYLDD